MADTLTRMGVSVTNGVAETWLEKGPVPALFAATTLKKYVVSLVRFTTVHDVAATAQTGVSLKLWPLLTVAAYTL